MVKSVTVGGRRIVWRSVAGHKERNTRPHSYPALSVLPSSVVLHRDRVVTETAPTTSGTSAGKITGAGTRAIAMGGEHTALRHN